MKYIHMYIQPRRSGKTTDLIDSAVDSAMISGKPESIVILTINDHHKKMLENATNLRVLSQHKFNNEFFPFHDIKHVYIDEWYLFDKENRKRIYQVLYSLGNLLEGIYIFTSPTKIYSGTLIDCIKLIKAENPELLECIHHEDAEELINDFLTDKDALIHSWYDQIKESLSPEDFKLQALGQWRE